MKPFPMDEYIKARDLVVVGYVHLWRPKYPSALCGARVIVPIWTQLRGEDVIGGKLCNACEHYMRELIYTEMEL